MSAENAPEARRSFFRSFRQSHPLMKLAFSICLLEVACLGVELLSYRYVSYAFGFHRPVFRQQLSGYRVFKEASNYVHAAPNGARPGETYASDANGFYSDHEVTVAKPADTLRIFLTGGSALAGAGQTGGLGYEAVHPYSGFAYAFSASIAGAFQDALREKNPGRRIEVVNAAYNQKAFHQSLVHYLEQISRYQPDYVIDMDGFNDLSALGREDAWSEFETRFLEPMVDLDNQAHKAQERTYTGLLLKLESEKHGWGRARASHATEGGASAPLPIRSEEQLRHDYETARPSWAPATQRWLQTFRHYLAVVGEDHVRFVFAVQPLLARAGANKKLSAIEKGFDAVALPRGDTPAIPALLMLRFYFDDFLAPELERLTKAHGQVFCDLGEALRPIGSDVEIYTDYCHLTPEGNRVVGRALAEKVQADLQAQAR